MEKNPVLVATIRLDKEELKEVEKKTNELKELFYESYKKGANYGTYKYGFMASNVDVNTFVWNFFMASNVCLRSTSAFLVAILIL